MKIIYRDIHGRRCVRHFSDWKSLCDWLRFHYPLRQAVNQLRGVAAAAESLLP